MKAAGLLLLVAWTGLQGQTAPIPTPPQPIFAAGGYHSLALDPQGRLWAWGLGRHGELGDGTTNRRDLPTAALPEAFPGPLTGLAAGEDHSLAWDAEGRLWAFGRNDAGQLGDGSATDRLAPVPVRGLPPIHTAGGGQSHSLALDRAGRVWAWGANALGQLGIADAKGSRVPVPVPGLKDIVAVSAGWRHNLALDRDGRVWEWGGRAEGQGAFAPHPVPGLAGIVSLAAGGRHNLALRGDGTVWAWGANDYGQLGDGGTQARNLPVQVPGLAKVRQIAAGYDHSAALLEDGTAWAWGDNNQGQLGNPVPERSLAPVPISGWNAPLKDLDTLRAGGYHTLLLTRGRKLLACGQNVFGQLGDWNFADSALPKDVLKQVLQGGR
jgi:alpha-tubulin suppressor-like RCC1 family protein